MIIIGIIMAFGVRIFRRDGGADLGCGIERSLMDMDISVMLMGIMAMPIMVMVPIMVMMAVHKYTASQLKNRNTHEHLKNDL